MFITELKCKIHLPDEAQIQLTVLQIIMSELS